MEIKAVYDRPYLRGVSLAMAWHAAIKRLLIVIAVCTLFFWLIKVADFYIIISIMLAYCVLVVGILYYRYYRLNLVMLKTQDPLEVTFNLSEEEYAYQSKVGRSYLPWTSISRIYLHKNFWLVRMHMGLFFSLPIKEFSNEQKHFFLEKSKQAGARIK